MSDSIKVMLVDDHAVVRAGYTFLLENIDDIEVVAEASDGASALHLFSTIHPDIVVLDLTMPGMNGFDVIGQIREIREDAHILVFSMHEDSAFVERALQEGAYGYISKNSSPEILIDAIRHIAQGEIYIDSGIAQKMVIHQTRKKGSAFAGLSRREFQILCMFAEASPIEEIARELSLSNKTIANYLTQIKEKLQVKNTAELIRLAISKGLVSV